MDNTEIFLDYLKKKQESNGSAEKIADQSPNIIAKKETKKDDRLALDLDDALHAFSINIEQMERLDHQLYAMSELVTDMEVRLFDWARKDDQLFERLWSRFTEERAKFIKKCGDFFAINASQPGEPGFLRLRLPDGKILSLEAGYIALGDGVVDLLRSEKPDSRQNLRHLASICDRLLKDFHAQMRKMVQRYYWLEKHRNLLQKMGRLPGAKKTKSKQYRNEFFIPPPQPANGLSEDLLACFEGP